MSLRGDISAWCVARLDSQVTQFRDVKQIGDPEELQLIASNPPSAGVMITKGSDTGTEAPPGMQYIFINVEVWFSANAFMGIEALDDTDGAYETLDDIWNDAFKEQTPTSAFEQLRYIDDEIVELANGLVIWVARYRTTAVI